MVESWQSSVPSGSEFRARMWPLAPLGVGPFFHLLASSPKQSWSAPGLGGEHMGEGTQKPGMVLWEEAENMELFVILDLQGLHSLLYEPARVTAHISSVSVAPRHGIEGGEGSWQGTPWSGTSHNSPQRPLWVCCLSQAKMSMGSPSAQPASDLFSQKCGWICSVPSALSHWPPRPPSVYRLSDSWLRQGGHCVTIECATATGSNERDPGAFTSLALGSRLNIPRKLGPQRLRGP